MKRDSQGNFVHEDYTSSFEYKNRTFIVDKCEDYWLITESQFLVKEKGSTLEEATKKIKESWDKVEHKYSKF